MSTFAQRLIRAARLDAEIYEEVEADTTATGQATAAVVLSSLAAGIATVAQGGGLGGIVGGAVYALLAWYVWALLTYWIGTRLLPEPQTKADAGELLRTTGFSSAPGIIRILGAISPITRLVCLVAHVWMLLAMIVAVRQALDYSHTLRAVAVCATGWVIAVSSL